MKDKEVFKEFRLVANELPRLDYCVLERQIISGADAKLTGQDVIDGESVEDEKEYQFKSPVYYAVNHYRRMKGIYKAYKNQGFEIAFAKVAGYITGCNAYIEKSLHEQN